jgi:predicted hydrocarbon binding protein
MAGQPEQKPPEEKQKTPLQTAFFIMPGNALKSLRDELQISAGEKMTEGILYRYGFRCGEGQIQNMDIVCEDMISISEVLPGLWGSVGLGRIQLKDITDSGMTVLFKESIEAMTIGQSQTPSCDFTRGYLAGMASALSTKSFNAIETECMAKGDQFCSHKLALTKTDVAPGQETEAKTQSKYNLERGASYLLEEDAPDKSYDIFVDNVTHGGQGLCITRDYPEKVRKKYNLKKTPILWLSNAESEFAIEPVQLGKLYHYIEDFLKKSKDSVVLLCGIEYIITQNNYTSALKFLQLVRDQISIYDSLLIAPISPATLNERDLKMIEREMKVFPLK